MERINATTVAIEGHGVMLRGPSGAGKSDLALRLISSGAHLVADDFTDIEVLDDRLIASAPPTIVGLLEVRGLGVLRITPVSTATLAVCIDLVPLDRVDRMPLAQVTALGQTGLTVPLFRLSPFEASVAAKVRLAVQLCTGTILRAI